MNAAKCHFKFINRTGSIMIATIVFTVIFLIIATALIGLAGMRRKIGIMRKTNLISLEIAEAGVNYYRWHLAHAPEDYADGTGQTGCSPCGPYIHDYYDPAGGIIGQYSLLVTPPPTGSTIVKIKSTGWSNENLASKRSVAVRFGRPSWAKFAVLSDDALHQGMRFGNGTIVHGPIHSNWGIRFDGITYNIVTSYETNYNDPDHNGADEYAVHTHKNTSGVVVEDFGIDPTPPTALPSRLDVFAAGRQFPVPKINFASITMDLNTLQGLAGENLGNSTKMGWHIVLNNDHTFSYRKVRTTSGNCSGSDMGQITQYSGNWATRSMPSNGIIFVEDDLWINGQINGDRLTIVAAKTPLDTGMANITINNDILYTHKDGTDSIGLITQNNINIGLYSEDDLEIDAALIAQKGRVGRNYFSSSCDSTYYKRGTITNYGTIATNQRYGFSWTCGGIYCSGYANRNLIFDNNLTYTPPPNFPTAGEYEFISWEEVIENEIY